MNNSTGLIKGGFGFTVTRFFESINGNELRQFINPDILSLLDSISAENLSDDNLRNIIPMLIDVYSMLGKKDQRDKILNLIPKQKRAELEDRIGRNIYPVDKYDWTSKEMKSLRDFFGLVGEKISAPNKVATNSIVPAYSLFEHQREAVKNLKPLLFDGDRKAVLHFPTGAGKTRAAMHLVAESLRNNDPSLVVWLSSGKELLEQAEEAFKEAWHHLGTRPVNICTMWADLEPNLGELFDGLLILGLEKAWSFSSRTDSDWALKLSKHVRLVVFDEAHQSIAKTYKQIAEDLTLDYRCGLLGLTATPGRTWADIDKDEKLSDFYSNNKVSLTVPSRKPIEYLMQNGYLARSNFKTFFSEPGLQLNRTEELRISKELEIPEEIVEKLSMSKQYITSILRVVKELLNSGHLRILVFAATVNHAKVLNAVFKVKNIESAVVVGKTSKRERENILREFKSEKKEPMVLINFGVLTTGFDAPKASAAVIARPTKSLVLYSQMVGRVIRGPKAGGTENCDIITIIDPNLPGFGNIEEAFLNWEDIW